MKILLGLVTVVGLSTASAFAGDGQIAKSSLSRMGLPGMTVMSDADGMSIRGTSFAISGSFAFASGGVTIPIINHPVGSHFAITATIAIGNGTFAGGFSSASAH
jgi:hypothetical protein